MPLHYDLHIHSCLSPCADEDMTPQNICAMARLKGLQMIAVADHQSAGNLPALDACARQEGLLLMPALEVCTREEVHLLAYFGDVEAALVMGAWCRELLPGILNRPDFFGRQVYRDAEDNELGEEPLLLLMALDAGLTEVVRKVRTLGGVPVPAHINRGSNGLLTALGFIPEEDGFTALETDRRLPLMADVSAYRVLHSSDAHNLGDIAEQGQVLPAEDVIGALRWLGGQNE